MDGNVKLEGEKKPIWKCPERKAMTRNFRQ